MVGKRSPDASARLVNLWRGSRGARKVRRRVHVGFEAVGYPDRGDLDRVPPKVGVARGRLHLRLTDQFARHRQTPPEDESSRGEAVW